MAPPVTVSDILRELEWCYDEAADKSSEKGPPKTYDGYEVENYFEIGIDVEFPTRHEAIIATLGAYIGPDPYGVGPNVTDLRAEVTGRG
jgi:hypothetical protein